MRNTLGAQTVGDWPDGSDWGTNMNGRAGKLVRGFTWVFGVAAIWVAVTVCIQLLVIALLRAMESSGLLATPHWYDLSFPYSWMPWPALIAGGLVVLVAAWAFLRISINIGGMPSQVLAGILVAAVAMVAWAVLRAPSAVEGAGIAAAHGWVRLSIAGALGSLSGSLLGVRTLSTPLGSERSAIRGA
jgi:hypothetical protein